MAISDQRLNDLVKNRTRKGPRGCNPETLGDQCRKLCTQQEAVEMALELLEKRQMILYVLSYYNGELGDDREVTDLCFCTSKEKRVEFREKFEKLAEERKVWPFSSSSSYQNGKFYEYEITVDSDLIDQEKT